MSYATRADIENQFGVENVRIWSQLDNSVATADTSRITAALAWAHEWIRATFVERGLEEPPVTPITTRWAAIEAATWLRSSRAQNPDQNDDGFDRIRASMIGEMQQYLARIRKFAAHPSASAPLAGPGSGDPNPSEPNIPPDVASP